MVLVLPLSEMQRRERQERIARSQFCGSAEIDSPPPRVHAPFSRNRDGRLERSQPRRRRDRNEAPSARLSDLQRRESIVERAFLFEKHIDLPTYERQRDEVRDAITTVTIELENARANHLDVEGPLRFSEGVLCNAAQLSTDAAPEQKQRLQAALVSSGPPDA